MIVIILIAYNSKAASDPSFSVTVLITHEINSSNVQSVNSSTGHNAASGIEISDERNFLENFALVINDIANYINLIISRI